VHNINHRGAHRRDESVWVISGMENPDDDSLQMLFTGMRAVSSSPWKIQRNQILWGKTFQYAGAGIA